MDHPLDTAPCDASDSLHPGHSLYRRLLGADFDRLPPALRTFHSGPNRAAGSMRVDRATGVIARLLGRALALPRAAESVAVTLRTLVDGDDERWSRTFGDQALVTRQRARDGLLQERFGPLELRFRVKVVEDGMHFEQVGSRLLGIGLPRRLSPRVDAVIRGDDDPRAWTVDLRLSVPLIGSLCRYQGRMVLA